MTGLAYVPPICAKSHVSRGRQTPKGPTHRSDVGQAEGSSAQVGRSQLAGGAQLLQPVEFPRHVHNAEQLHVLDGGHQQTEGRVHGHADVVRRLATRRRTERTLTKVVTRRRSAGRPARAPHLVRDVLTGRVQRGVEDGEAGQAEGGGLSQ